MTKLFNRSIASTLLLLLSMGPALIPASAVAQPNEGPNRVVGVWTFYALFPGAQESVFVGNARFAKDGTISGTPIDQRTGSTLGLWEQVGGGNYAFSFVANVSDTSGTYTATHRVRGMMTLSEDGQTATGSTRLDVLDPAGKVIFTASSTFTGVRLTVQPF